MEEDQPTCSSINLPGEDASETSHGEVHETLKDGNQPSVLSAEALFYAMPYMSLQDLLSMEQVCRASRDWVRDGANLWRSLRVEPPLSRSFTDEILVRLSRRSNGQLECLCLVDCLRITEGAVEQVVLCSPRLTKLSLTGCSGITAEGVVNMVRAHTDQRTAGISGMKWLKLRNITGLAEHHLQNLLAIMGVGEVPSSCLKPWYFNDDYHSLSCCDYKRPLDVEVCPKCRNIRMVFDCTRDQCQAKQECRACVLCTVRCANCGVCLKDDECNETVCLDSLCSDCWPTQPKCSECNRPACGRHSSNSFEVRDSALVCSECIVFSLTPNDLEYDL